MGIGSGSANRRLMVSNAIGFAFQGEYRPLGAPMLSIVGPRFHISCIWVNQFPCELFGSTSGRFRLKCSKSVRRSNAVGLSEMGTKANSTSLEATVKILSKLGPPAVPRLVHVARHSKSVNFRQAASFSVFPLTN
jgi:hypothetical protein